MTTPQIQEQNRKSTPRSLRYAEPDETPLSAAEVLHGMRHGLIWHSPAMPVAAHPAPAREAQPLSGYGGPRERSLASGALQQPNLGAAA